MEATHRNCLMPALLGTAVFTLLYLGAPGGAEASTITLRDDAPVIVKLPDAPRDKGHRHTLVDLQKLSKRLSGGRDGSATEGAAGHVLLAHPLRKGITNPRPGFYAISNYVDQDPAAPDMLLDYECGERTYDLEDGTNHNGVDYFNFPFSWMGMQQDASIVVAAADGTIVEKHDGEPDMNCSFVEDAESNQIVLEHADGSFTLYAHLKQGSTTARGVGDMVEKGDYLGVVGSSGFSNGPHLHFGVYDSVGGLIEPHAGACNDLNDDSWWEVQENYYEPGMNLIATHSEVPEIPDCPGIEQPHLQNTFGPGDTAFFSGFFRDALMGETTNLEIRDSNGVQVLAWEFDYEDTQHSSALMVVWGVDFGGNAPAGAYTFRVTYAGTTREHTFYIDSGPNPPPAAKSENNAFSGLWFDPTLDGEGYNFVTGEAGTVIYFYGNDAQGNRLWLISDLIQGDFGDIGPIEVTMYESTGGSFGSPVSSARGLSEWGTLLLEIEDCNNAVAMLAGGDGNKLSLLVKLAGISGTSCTTGAARPDSPWSGLWFDIGDEGEGYNLIVAPNGGILYYYGFKSGGDRLWLISDLIAAGLQIGEAVEVAMLEAVQGEFDTPAPSNQLVQWGTATITLVDCTHITIVLAGNDGNKTSSTVRLAGVIGLQCNS